MSDFEAGSFRSQYQKVTVRLISITGLPQGRDTQTCGGKHVLFVQINGNPCSCLLLLGGGPQGGVIDMRKHRVTNVHIGRVDASFVLDLEPDLLCQSTYLLKR